MSSRGVHLGGVVGRPSVRARDQRGQALDWESGGTGWRPGRAPRGGRRAGSDPRPLVREHGAFPSLTLQSGSLLPRSWRLPRDGSTQLLATEARFCLVAAALGVRSRAGTCGRLPAPCAALPAAGFPTTCFAGVFPPQLAPWWGPHSALQPTRGTLGRDSPGSPGDCFAFQSVQNRLCPHLWLFAEQDLGVALLPQPGCGTRFRIVTGHPRWSPAGQLLSTLSRWLTFYFLSFQFTFPFQHTLKVRSCLFLGLYMVFLIELGRGVTGAVGPELLWLPGLSRNEISEIRPENQPGS